MSADDETGSRDRLDAYLDKLARPALKGRVQIRRAKAIAKTGKRLVKTNPKMHRTRKRDRKRLARTAKPARTYKGRGPHRGPFTLVELLVLRTDGATWYTFAQLRALLPETTEAGVKGIVFQRCVDLGIVERAPIITDPDRPWIDGETKLEKRTMATRARYRYRIGAEIEQERARLRAKWSAYGDVAE